MTKTYRITSLDDDANGDHVTEIDKTNDAGSAGEAGAANKSEKVSMPSGDDISSSSLK